MKVGLSSVISGFNFVSITVLGRFWWILRSMNVSDLDNDHIRNDLFLHHSEVTPICKKDMGNVP